MKNLFDYAVKELSQDAFLRWLFESYQEIEIEPIVNDFLNFLTEGKLPNKKVEDSIVMIKAWSQNNSIDLVFEIGLLSGENYLLVIEDKVSSKEHGQLAKYTRTIRSQNKDLSRIFWCFYKTDEMKNAERNRVQENGWTIFDYDRICDFWENYRECPNDIVRQYSEHLYSYRFAKRHESKILLDIIAKYAKEHPQIMFAGKQYRKDYAIIYLDALKKKGLQNGDSHDDEVWIWQYLGIYQGSIRLYLGFKQNATSKIKTPRGFIKSGWCSDYGTIEYTIGSPCDLLSQEGIDSIYTEFAQAIDLIVASSTD